MWATPTSPSSPPIAIQSNIFDEYRIEGKDERNEIYLEVNMEQLSRSLRSALNAQVVKLKLTKKQGPCLTVEIAQVFDRREDLMEQYRS